jgi:hypothetical protein
LFTRFAASGGPQSDWNGEDSYLRRTVRRVCCLISQQRVLWMFVDAGFFAGRHFLLAGVLFSVF